MAAAPGEVIIACAITGAIHTPTIRGMSSFLSLAVHVRFKPSFFRGSHEN
jgi:hypothetical protein